MTNSLLRYGSIGYACAKLAKAYGMRIIALRRNPEQSRNDSLVDTVSDEDKISISLEVLEYSKTLIRDSL